MSYINNSLIANEQVQFKVSYFWLTRYQIYAAYVFGVILIPVFIGILILIWALYKHLVIVTTERAVTNMRVVQKKGIVSINTEEIIMNAIETVTIHQSVTERILGGGSVTVTGRGGISIVLQDIDDPLEVKKIIENQRW
jgi:uncharacterized membrane protein YdbT with pleckstrin-like domain